MNTFIHTEGLFLYPRPYTEDALQSKPTSMSAGWQRLVAGWQLVLRSAYSDCLGLPWAVLGLCWAVFGPMEINAKPRKIKEKDRQMKEHQSNTNENLGKNKGIDGNQGNR